MDKLLWTANELSSFFLKDKLKEKWNRCCRTDVRPYNLTDIEKKTVRKVLELIGTLRSDNGDVHENFAEKYSVSFQTISRLSQVAQLLKRREVMLNLPPYLSRPENNLNFGDFTS